MGGVRIADGKRRANVDPDWNPLFCDLEPPI